MRIVAFLAVGLVALWSATAPAQPVDINLVLSVDSSGSIDDEEFRLQREGYARALTDSEILQAIRQGPYGAVAVSFVEWSGPEIHSLVVDWTRISGPADAERVAAALMSADRTIFGGGTSIAGAIAMSMNLLGLSPFKATRRVIDISGDGPDNRGPRIEEIRRDAIGRGITINGLPIIEFDSGLDVYFREFVIGGPGAFVQPANGFADFARAVRRKLLQELNLSRYGPPVSPSG